MFFSASHINVSGKMIEVAETVTLQAKIPHVNTRRPLQVLRKCILLAQRAPLLPRILSQFGGALLHQSSLLSMIIFLEEDNLLVRRAFFRRISTRQ